MATRIQFYPNSDLETKLRTKSQSLGIPTSQLVIDILESIDIGSYCLQPNSPASYLSDVILEMKSFASTKSPGDTFSIRESSSTFSSIPATFLSKGGVRPSPVRAKLGTLVFKQIESGAIPEITIAKDDNDKFISDSMGALLYIVN